MSVPNSIDSNNKSLIGRRLRHRSISSGTGVEVNRKQSMLSIEEDDTPRLPIPSPDSPVRKTWERQYRSFLAKRSAKGQGPVSQKGIPLPDLPKITQTAGKKGDYTADEHSVRGGGFFGNVFRSSEKTMRKGHDRRAKSFSHTDELDGARHHGTPKSPGSSRHAIPYDMDAPPSLHSLSLSRSRSVNDTFRMNNPSPTTTLTLETSGAIPTTCKEEEDITQISSSYTESTGLTADLFREENNAAFSRSASAMKKAFTEFHNSSATGSDANSAFLGDDPSTSWVHRQRSALATSGLFARKLQPGNRLASVDRLDHLDFSNATGSRVLKPILGVETWQNARRYLMGPAIVADSPVSLWAHQLINLSDATTDDSAVYNTILLGPCFICDMSKVNDHMSSEEWSSAELLLYQNCLLEFSSTEDRTSGSRPRGYMHLQYAVAEQHPLFDNALQVRCYGSPCAKSDARLLLICLAKPEERELWISCINRAGLLNLDFMYEFNAEKPLGTGAYSSVYQGRRKQKQIGSIPSQHCDRALKVFKKEEFWRHVMKGRERADTVVREASVQSVLTVKYGPTVPSLVKLLGFFETSEHVVLELELLDGRDLFHHITQAKGALEEKDAARILKDLLQSLQAMKKAGIAHRDIKPANLLMSSGSDTVIKVGDFGMATFVGVDGKVRGRCGTPGYVAPEIFTAGVYGGYDNKIDVFSAGVTLYVMLCGYEPFYGETDAELVEANKVAEVDFPDEDWSKVSPFAKDLVKKMMHKDPNERVNVEQAMHHPWLTRHLNGQDHLQVGSQSSQNTCVIC